MSWLTLLMKGSANLTADSTDGFWMDAPSIWSRSNCCETWKLSRKKWLLSKFPTRLSCKSYQAWNFTRLPASSLLHKKLSQHMKALEANWFPATWWESASRSLSTENSWRPLRLSFLVTWWESMQRNQQSQSCSASVMQSRALCDQLQA